MTVVLVVVIVVLLAVLGTGTAVALRRQSSARSLGRGATATPERPVPPPAPAPRLRAPGETAGHVEVLEESDVEGEEEAPPRPHAHAPASSVAPPRLRDRLGRSKGIFSAPFAAIRGGARLDERAFEDLEEALILADVGVPTTTRLLDELRQALRTGTVAENADALAGALKAAVVGLFDGEDRSLAWGPGPADVWLFVGVNGVGKTTTIGKLAAREGAAGRSVVLAAGDTFRAAAAEQLQLWAERSGAGFIHGAEGADPSSVIFDAIQHAAARGADLVLADSAGRLHTKVNLMEELRKVRRIADRPPGSVREVLLVIDATTGQNGLIQARQFAEAVEVTGIVLTKLDGTAKGGIVLAIRAELGLPIKLVGVGESAEDLVDFDPVEFAEALFS